MVEFPNEKKVDAFIKKQPTWGAELAELRKIVNATGMEENFKWRNPCYLFEGKNVVLLGAFKNHCALLFMSGSLIDDRHGLLVQPTENSNGGRYMKFTSVEEINEQRAVINEYLIKAMENAENNLKVDKTATKKIDMPKEMVEIFVTDPEYKVAFESLTPGRQRSYLLHFSSAKTSATITNRVNKCREKVFEKKGFNER